MFEELQKPIKWKKVVPIKKGWSNDAKYYIETEDDQKLLLRLSDIVYYEQKKKEFDITKKYSALNFEMSKPVGFGALNSQQNVYMLLTWVDGRDLELTLPELDRCEQYRLGREAGEILKKIHSMQIPANEQLF